MRLTTPRLLGAARLTLQFGRDRRISVLVRPTAPRRVRIPVCAARKAHVTYWSNVRRFIGVRAVSVQSTAPVFTPSASACEATQAIA